MNLRICLYLVFMMMFVSVAHCEELLKSNQTANTTSKQIPETLLEKWMNQPVAETLKGAGVIYVNDDNYDREVKNSDRPVMVLFYTDGSSGSRGLGALISALNKQFQMIKICAYEVDGHMVDNEEMITPEQFFKLRKEYGTKDFPALLFYKPHSGGRTLGDNYNMYGGIKSFKFMKNELEFYYNNLKNGYNTEIR